MHSGKLCANCRIHKPYTDFWRDSSKRDGFDCSCIHCRKSRRRQTKKHRQAQATSLFFDGVTKECKGCRQIKPVSKFSRNRTYASGYEGKCKQCIRTQRKAKRAAGRPAKAHRFFDGISRECSKCEAILPLANFHRDRTNPSGYSAWCKKCRKNARGHSEGTYAPEFKQKLVTLLGGGCALCGYASYLTALQFHHVNPGEKSSLISRLLKKHSSLTPELSAELDKCCLLCANCHQALHAREINVRYTKRASLGWEATLI